MSTVVLDPLTAVAYVADENISSIDCPNCCANNLSPRGRWTQSALLQHLGEATAPGDEVLVVVNKAVTRLSTHAADARVHFEVVRKAEERAKLDRAELDELQEAGRVQAMEAMTTRCSSCRAAISLEEARDGGATAFEHVRGVTLVLPCSQLLSESRVDEIV